MLIPAQNESDVVEAVRVARETKRTLEIVGAGSKRNFGRSVLCDDVLDVSRLRGIVKYEPEELVLTVLPGTPVREIEALLAEKRQRLGFDPADWGPLLGAPAGRATLGGVLSADACGSAAVRYGRARDSLLGFRAVNGLAEAYKAGGRVVKNVTGFDLPKLMCGAMGTLGVLTEVTLRVFPKPEHVACFAAKDIDAREGLGVLRRVWSSALEATGLSYVPSNAASAFDELGDIGHGAALIRLEGSAAALAEKASMLRALCAVELVPLEDGDAIFRKIGSASAFAAATDDVWRLRVPPSHAEDCIDAGTVWLGDWAGGSIWLQAPFGSGAQIRDPMNESGGHATLIRASKETRGGTNIFEQEHPIRAALTKSVKAAFDPLGLFNPGRMWDGV